MTSCSTAMPRPADTAYSSAPTTGQTWSVWPCSRFPPRPRYFVRYFIAGGRLHNVVCVIEETSWTRELWSDLGDPDQLRAAFAGWHPVVGALIDVLDQPLRWALFDRPPLPRWSSGPVTLLGDASHPMLPYGAQGAAQAIEDAAVLAACLVDAGAREVPAGLARYETIRRPGPPACRRCRVPTATVSTCPTVPISRSGTRRWRRVLGISPTSAGSTATIR
jgi:salicylate hydroxylase